MRRLSMVSAVLLLAALPLVACGGGSGSASPTEPAGLAGNTSTLAGDGVPAGTDSTDGTGATARFDFPRDIATDGTWLYVSESQGARVRRVHPTTGETTTLAGDGIATYRDSSDGTGATAGFVEPRGLVFWGGFLYLTDVGAHRIRRIDVATGATGTPAGDGQAASRDSVDTTGTTASFHTPVAVATDGVSIFVCEREAGRVRVVDPVTGFTRTLAGNGLGIDQESFDGTGGTAGFRKLFAMTRVGEFLYVASATRIYRVHTITGAATFFAGQELPGFRDSTDGTGATALFRRILGLCSDGVSLFVSDETNARIRRVDLMTGETTTLAGDGVPLFADSTDGTGATARFRSPRGCLQLGGSLFVADGESQRIRVIR